MKITVEVPDDPQSKPGGELGAWTASVADVATLQELSAEGSLQR
jgi:hypothetical protein